MKLLIGLIIFLVLVIMGGIGFIGYSLYSNNINHGTKIEEVKVEEENLVNYEIKDMILNISAASGKEKLMKLYLTLKINGTEENLKELEYYDAEFKDIIITTSNEFHSEDLLTQQGKQLFKDSLFKNFGFIFNNKSFKLNKILFQEFVIK